MKKAEIRVGGHYLAKVSGAVVTVRVDAIREGGGAATLGQTVTCYEVTNLATGRHTTFRSAAKFRGTATPPPSGGQGAPVRISEDEGDRLLATIQAKPQGGEHRPDPTPAPTAVAPRPTAPVGALAPVASGTASLAASITAARKPTRAPGTPVAGMVPNVEQETILAAAVMPGLRALVIGAGAGTGKTATLKMLEQVLPGRGQYTAFNSALVAESKAKFVKVAVNTTHSLAFRTVGKAYQHRLNGDRMRSDEVARRLGIAAQNVVLRGLGRPELCGAECKGKDCARCGGAGTVPTNKVKQLKPGYLAGQVMTALRRFCQSVDREVGTGHFTHIDGIDVNTNLPADENGSVRRQRERENNDKIRAYLLPFARVMWADIVKLDGQLPFCHDDYVKIWQLGVGGDLPVIAADYILLDEAQDTAPVFLDILKQQTHALLIFVGDSNQAIYEWRGAVDAMRAYPDAERRMLSQSYRFGQAVADVANAVLATLDEKTDLVMRGNPAIQSRVAEVAEPRCYLYRTNAGAVGRVMIAISQGKRPCLMGTKDYVSGLVKWMEAAMDLQAKPARKTYHPELACFDTWDEVSEYITTDEGGDLRLMVKLVEEFGAAKIRAALQDMPKEADADLVVSTAHKSKGREWETVRLGPDFPTANKMGDADRRLLYVAATRAQHVLDITECPPFCGGYDPPYSQSRADWVPGIRVTYTRPMTTLGNIMDGTPTAEYDQSPVRLTIKKPAPAAEVPEAPAPEEEQVVATYIKLRTEDCWGLRAEGALTPGQQVSVRMNSSEVRTETVGRIVWSGNGVTLATKE